MTGCSSTAIGARIRTIPITGAWSLRWSTRCLCRTHHAAFDRYFLGVSPDYVVHVRPDLLHEKDGPTLVHAIQALDGQRIILPRRREQRPDVNLLAMRYERFRKAASF